MATVEAVKYVTLSQPRQVRLDTTTQCNALCPSCHRHDTKRTGTMPRDMIKQIISDLSQWQTPLNEIVPVNYGEFFLYKFWYWVLIEIAKNLPKTRIVIPTNGSQMTGEVVDGLADIPNISVINFSVNAYFQETYTRFMGFAQYIMDNIREACIKLRLLRPDITLWVSMVNDPAYQSDLERELFKEYWRPYATPQILNAASAGRADNRPLYPLRLPCRSIYSDFVIGYDGKLSSCCFDAGFVLELGNYSKDILKDWKNPQIEELRRMHNEGNRAKYDLCKLCSFA